METVRPVLPGVFYFAFRIELLIEEWKHQQYQVLLSEVRLAELNSS